MPDVLQAETEIILYRFPLGFHAPQSHTYPPVQAAVCIAAVGPWRGEVVRRAADNAVEFLDHGDFQVVAPLGQRTDLGLEVLHRLGSHPDETRLDVEAQKGESFMEPRHLRLLGAQR